MKLLLIMALGTEFGWRRSCVAEDLYGIRAVRVVARHAGQLDDLVVHDLFFVLLQRVPHAVYPAYDMRPIADLGMALQAELVDRNRQH